MFKSWRKEAQEMKRLLFLLIFISEIAYSANWMRVTSSNDGDVVFVDSLSMQRSGNTVTFWSKMNYGVRDRSGDLSSKTQRAVNCMTREVKSLYLMTYDDFDNQGKLTHSDRFSNQSWNPIAPETINDAVRRFVCK